MNAIEFVGKFGWDVAISFTDRYGGNTAFKFLKVKEKTISVHSGDQPYDFHINNLKQLVESYELVEKYKNRHGGIRFRIRWGMFRYGDAQEFNDRLKQALNLVEPCQ